MRFSAGNFFLALLWLCGAFSAQAQDSCTFQCRIKMPAQYAAADVLGNLYVINGFDIVKFDSTGRQMAKYSNNRLETPHAIDVSNPMKMLVWYDYFQTLVFLDRNMTELGRLNLIDVGLGLAVDPVMASDGNIWIYNLDTYKLLKINTLGEVLLESQPLTLLAENMANALINSAGIRENGEQVFLGFDNVGIVSFDIFAQNPKVVFLTPYFLRFEILERTGIAADAAGVFYRFDTNRLAFDKPVGVKCLIDGPTFWLSRRKVFQLKKDMLEVYRF